MKKHVISYKYWSRFLWVFINVVLWSTWKHLTDFCAEIALISEFFFGQPVELSHLQRYPVVGKDYSKIKLFGYSIVEVAANVKTLDFWNLKIKALFRVNTSSETWHVQYKLLPISKIGTIFVLEKCNLECTIAAQAFLIYLWRHVLSHLCTRMVQESHNKCHFICKVELSTCLKLTYTLQENFLSLNFKCDHNNKMIQNTLIAVNFLNKKRFSSILWPNARKPNTSLKRMRTRLWTVRTLQTLVSITFTRCWWWFLFTVIEKVWKLMSL